MSKDIPYIDNFKNLAAEFRKLYSERIQNKINHRKERTRLNAEKKVKILQKTNFHCHICGEKIDETDFQADHISPHSIGGTDNINNFLPSCPQCNGYGWNYLPDEIKWILKIGVWAKTQIEFETEIGKDLAQSFIFYENKREKRRKVKRSPLRINPSDYPIRELSNYSKK